MWPIFKTKMLIYLSKTNLEREISDLKLTEPV